MRRNLHVLLYECFLIARIGTGYRHSRSTVAGCQMFRPRGISRYVINLTHIYLPLVGNYRRYASPEVTRT